jgi:hypothetical protein
VADAPILLTGISSLLSVIICLMEHERSQMTGTLILLAGGLSLLSGATFPLSGAPSLLTGGICLVADALVFFSY